MKVHYDLHVHSVLSPCADVLMTPNNLLNMATLKGLDILAIADHNGLGQLPVLSRIAASYRLLFVPAVEIALDDGAHVLVYFRKLAEAMRFDAELAPLVGTLPAPAGKTAPMLSDEEDRIVRELPYDLGKNLPIGLEDLCRLLDKYDHLRYFAHLDRTVRSGIRPDFGVRMDGVELTEAADVGFLAACGLPPCRILRNSDAHGLPEIAECGEANALELDELTIDALFAELRRG